MFSEEASERLERLRIVCRQATGSNVIRLALMVLEDTVKAANAGTIEFKDKNGKLVRNYHPLLEPEPDQVSEPRVAADSTA